MSDSDTYVYSKALCMICKVCKIDVQTRKMVSTDIWSHWQFSCFLLQLVYSSSLASSATTVLSSVTLHTYKISFDKYA